MPAATATKPRTQPAKPTGRRVSTGKKTVKKPLTPTQRFMQAIGADALRAQSIQTGQHKKEWTAKDDELVVRDDLSLEYIAGKLHRSYNAVASRRAALRRRARTTQGTGS